MDPLASQVISDESEIVKKLPGYFYEASTTNGTFISSAVKIKCNEFVATFIENREVNFPRKLTHDGTWKETENERGENFRYTVGVF